MAKGYRKKRSPSKKSGTGRRGTKGFTAKQKANFAEAFRRIALGHDRASEE